MAIVLTTLVEVVLRLDGRGGAAEFRAWSTGSLTAVDPAAVLWTAPYVVAGTLAALWSAPRLNGLALGEDLAAALGQSVGRTRAVAALGVVLLCGSAVAMAGPIAFVGLLVPHAVRALCGPDYRWILGLGAVLGPALLVACDVVGRVVGGDAEVPAGVVVGVVGAPVFVYVARRRRQVAM